MKLEEKSTSIGPTRPASKLFFLKKKEDQAQTLIWDQVFCTHQITKGRLVGGNWDKRMKIKVNHDIDLSRQVSTTNFQNLF